jgi:hypothetical protein
MMRNGQNWLMVGKVVFGGLLIGAGSFLAFHAGTNGSSTANGYAVSIAHAQQGAGNSSAYCAKWTADKLITIDTSGLKIGGTATTSTKRLFAIGPQHWTVSYYTYAGSGACGGGDLLATENWDATTPPACYTGTACSPSGANSHQYLFGLVAPNQTGGINTDYANMTFGVKDWNDNGLFSTTNPRFVGPGAVGNTNLGTNIEGYYASGAYGWIAGAFDGDSGTGGRDYTEAAGIMMPLQWNVTGTLYAN